MSATAAYASAVYRSNEAPSIAAASATRTETSVKAADSQAQTATGPARDSRRAAFGPSRAPTHPGASSARTTVADRREGSAELREPAVPGAAMSARLAAARPKGARAQRTRAAHPRPHVSVIGPQGVISSGGVRGGAGCYALYSS